MTLTIGIGLIVAACEQCLLKGLPLENGRLKTITRFCPQALSND